MASRYLFWTCLLAALLFQIEETRAVETDTRIGGLIERIAPGHAKYSIVETIPAAVGGNVFEIDTVARNKIVLRGDGPLSQAVAFNWYLKYGGFVDVSWYADDVVRLLITSHKSAANQLELQQMFGGKLCLYSQQIK